MPEFKIVISDPKAKSDKGIGVKVIGDSELKYGVDEKEGKKIPRAKVNPRLLKILNAELGFITIRIWKSKESREKVNFTFHAIPDESLDVQVIKVPEDLLREKLGVSEIIGEVFRTRSFQVVISGDKAQQLLGLRIGDRFDGSIVGLPGKILEIRGGSDSSGFPMRPDIPGGVKKRVLLSTPPGFHPRENGERRRKTVRGNVIVEDTVQINTVILYQTKK